MYNVFGLYIDQIHWVLNKSKKYFFAYKYERKEYIELLFFYLLHIVSNSQNV